MAHGSSAPHFFSNFEYRVSEDGGPKTLDRMRRTEDGGQRVDEPWTEYGRLGVMGKEPFGNGGFEPIRWRKVFRHFHGQSGLELLD